jgi:hypothetical protein
MLTEENHGVGCILSLLCDRCLPGYDQKRTGGAGESLGDDLEVWPPRYTIMKGTSFKVAPVDTNVQKRYVTG